MSNSFRKELISVIIPVLNREKLIGETLDCLLCQTYTNWECIIVDDGSSDNTMEVVKTYARKDKRFNFYQRPATRKKGASSCRNFGLDESRGDYIQFLDSDDLLKDNKFEEQLKLLRKAAPLSIATCKWGSFSDSSQLNVKTQWNSYGNFKYSLKLLYKFGKYDEYFPPIVYLVPRDIIGKTGPWNENLSHNDDAEYFSRVLLNVNGIVFCETTEAYYRAGDKNRLSLLDNEKKIKSAIESWKMIARQLEPHKKVAEMYVGNGINNIYKRIRDSYPELIRENKVFFRGRKKASQNWIDKILSSLKNIS